MENKSSWVALKCVKTSKYLVGLRSDGKGWNFFGGCVEEWESPDDAALREFAEETSITLRRVTLFHDSSGVNMYVSNTDQEIDPVLNDEHTAYAWLTLDEIKERDLHKVTDAFVKKLDPYGR